MEKVVKELQSVTSLPLQIDTVDGKAMERAMRIYNGKPMINSVNGKQVSMDEVFPLVRKYGGVVVGLTIDEEGIPKDAEGRVRVAGKIINEAAKYGIDKKDIVIDVLTMTISSEKDGAKGYLGSIEESTGRIRGQNRSWSIEYFFWTSKAPDRQQLFLCDGNAERTDGRNHQSILRRYDESLSFL